MTLRAALILSLSLWLAACGEIPRPFADDRPALGGPILTISDAAGIYIEPVTGTAPGQEGAIAEAMATAFRDQEVLANAQHAGRRNYHLSGDARNTEIHEQTAVIVIEWTLRGPDGIVTGHETTSLTLPLQDWQQAATKPLARALAQSATRLASLLQDDPGALHAVAPTAILLRMAQGAPSDGAKLLPRTLEFLMKQQNRTVTLDPGTPDAGPTPKTPGPAILPVVMMGPPSGGLQHIAIHWRVFNAEGGLLGTVDQENDIPAGSLDRSWGELAGIVAEAAVGDILKLLDQAALKTITKL